MIITIQPGDELNTIIHKLQNVQGEHVTLQALDEVGLLRDPLVWRVVANYGQNLQLRITVDSPDPTVCQEAVRAGLDVAQKHLLAVSDEQEHEGQPETESKVVERRGRLIERLSVVLLILAAGLGLIYLTLPKVTVVVTPAVQGFTHVLNFPISGLESAEAIEAEITLTRKTSATGRKTIGVTKAIGEIILINQGEEGIIIPRGTVVTTASGTPFQITTDVEVPGIATQYFMGIPVGIQAGQAAAPIEALSPGSSGNVAAGRVDRIVGFDLDVRNPESTRGGSDTELQIAVEEDFVRARQMIERDAKQALLAHMEGYVSGSALEFAGETLDVQINWTEQTALGEETQEVLVTAVVRGRAYVLDETAFFDEVQTVLQGMLPDGHFLLPQSVVLGDVKLLGEPGSKSLRVTAEGKTGTYVSTDEITELVLGAPVDALGAIADSLPQVAQIEVGDYGGDNLPKLRRWLNVEIKDFSDW